MPETKRVRRSAKRPLIVSFSGGKTSAFMAAWLLANYSDQYIFYFVFANTGREHEETLKFVDACDKHFGLNVVWIEAVIDPRHGKGVRHKVVTFETASRNGGPFEAFIAKEGIPNTSRPHCTSRLKTRPIRSWMKANGLIDAPTALGMRADEPQRAAPDSASAKEFNLVYPLAHWHADGVTKQDVNDYWEAMPFTLNIPEHYGNCLTCFKKSDNKLMLIAKEQPDWFRWNVEMEDKHRYVNAKDGGQHKWWRKQRDTAQLLSVADIVDPEMLIMLTRSEPDAPGGCGEECRAFNVEDEADITEVLAQNKRARRSGSPPAAPTEYSIIYADPPWSYDDKAKNRGGAERHYVTTSDAELAEMQIPAAKDAAMFMWATFPKIQDAISLMKSWGFEYRTVAFVWVKANKKQTDSPFWGMGQWTRANAEVCLIGVRGKPQRQGKGVHQLIVEPEIITDPVMQHSRKPACVRDKIVELMGDLPRLEMFARESTPGWQVFGNEAPGSIALPVKRVRRSQQ